MMRKLPKMNVRVQGAYDLQFHTIAKKIDQIFCLLFTIQFVMGVLMALYVSPYAWEGANREIHMHVYAALGLGGLAAAFPVFLTYFYPGMPANRYVVAVAQMVFSTLFIHLAGGRIETHFHIFVSLALLAFYRDPKVLLLATLITASDHFLRGYYWPESIYGVLSASPWRALEHATWVIFEDIFLILGIKSSLRELVESSTQKVELQQTIAGVEEMVVERTAELEKTKQVLMQQQQTLVSTAKMSALGEMAGGIAHEINNPLAIIRSLSEQIAELASEKGMDHALIVERAEKLVGTTGRITKIVQGLRSFSRDGSNDPMQAVKVATLVEDTAGFCRERFQSHGIELRTENIDPGLSFMGRETQISQVLLNLLNNAHDAIIDLPEKWVRIHAKDAGEMVEIFVTDSGIGIDQEIEKNIFQPFFTTKEVGKGTGMGLSISLGIVKSHQGELVLDRKQRNTTFLLRLKKPI